MEKAFATIAFRQSWIINIMIYVESLSLILYSLKKRALRGWSLPYQGSCIDPRDQSHPLDPALQVPRASTFATIRLLEKDILFNFIKTSLEEEQGQIL